MSNLSPITTKTEESDDFAIATKGEENNILVTSHKMEEDNDQKVSTTCDWSRKVDTQITERISNMDLNSQQAVIFSPAMRWGVQLACKSSPRYLIASDNYNEKSVRGRFQLISAISHPRVVIYDVDFNHVVETCIYEECQNVRQIELCRTIMNKEREKRGGVLKPHDIVRMCNEWYLAYYKLILKGIERFQVHNLAPTTFYHLTDGQDFFSGKFPSDIYTNNVNISVINVLLKDYFSATRRDGAANM